MARLNFSRIPVFTITDKPDHQPGGRRHDAVRRATRLTAEGCVFGQVASVNRNATGAIGRLTVTAARRSETSLRVRLPL
jgi:hypothetical protein